MLESIFVSLTGTSFRQSSTENLVLNNQENTSRSANVKLQIEKNGLDSLIEFKIVENKKSHILNEKRVKVPMLSQNFPVIVFNPPILLAVCITAPTASSHT